MARPIVIAPSAGQLLRTWRSAGRGDLVAGVAVAAYLVPQCLAYARLAGLDPVVGLWTAVPALLAYAVLGGSPVLSVGPESASALLVGSSVALLGRTGEAEPAALASALALAVGVIALGSWAVRLGFLANLFSHPVLVGYLAGVAIIMIVSQLPNLTGIESDKRGTLATGFDVATGLDRVRLGPLLVGTAVVAALFALQRFRRLPGPLLVVAGAALLTAIFGLERHGVETVAAVPQGLPGIALPVLPVHLWPSVFGAAVGIALVAFSGAILTGRAFETASAKPVDPNRELLALAGANGAVGVFGGFPVSSSDSRTALVSAAGGRTQLSSVVAAGCVVVVLVVAAPLLEAFPIAALGGLVVYAAAQLVDLGEIRRIAAFRSSEAVIMAAALVGVVAFDLLVGIGVAVALSVADLLRRIARGHDAVQGYVPGLAGLHNIDDYSEAETVPGLVVYRYDAPLCFANAEDYHQRVTAAVAAERHPVEWLLLNMEANVEIDLTATDMLEELRTELAAEGITLALARVKKDLALYLDRAGLIERIGLDRIFPTLPTAVASFHNRGGAEPS